MFSSNQNSQFVTTKNEVSTFKSFVDKFSMPEDDAYIMINNDEFEKMVEQKVNDKVNEILQSREIASFKKINDDQARKKISSLILDMKNKGLRKINILDIIVNSNIPAEQTDRIMEEFRKEKKVTRVTLYGRT